MKLKVLKAFHDKNTDELYEVGKEIEVDAKRGKELLAHSLSLVEEIKEKKEQVKDTSKKK